MPSLELYLFGPDLLVELLGHLATLIPRLLILLKLEHALLQILLFCCQASLFLSLLVVSLLCELAHQELLMLLDSGSFLIRNPALVVV